MSKRNIFVIFLCLLTFCATTSLAMPLTSKAKINTAIQQKYESLEMKESAELMTLADGYLKSQKLDSALVCFSIVANRYKESMSKADKSVCAKAYYHSGTIFLNRYNDYTKALQSMQTVHDVAVEADDNSIMSGILIYMGNIYVFYAVRFENSLESFTEIEDKGVLFRYQFIPLCHISECYLLLGDTDKALGIMHDIEEKTLEFHLQDLVPEIYSRLEEACRRIDDKDNFGQFSIEGIGQSVGFNSRSTFTAAFKRVTGLTPSEYQREARKN